MIKDRMSWIDQLYGYTEYYYWEPQHIFKRKIPEKSGKAALEEMRARVRRNEVPLNAAFVIGLRLLPDTILNRLIGRSIGSNAQDYGKDFDLVNVYPYIDEYGNVTQPDAVLESDKSRVFFELKINHTIKFQQVQKYALLNAIWACKTGVFKPPYLLFLTPDGIHKSWSTGERDQIFLSDDHLAGLRKFLAGNPLRELPAKIKNLPGIQDSLSATWQALTVGELTWHQLGDALSVEINASVDNMPQSGSDQTLRKLIKDILIELNSRKLWTGD